jgi:endonuclease/exonuclease/phosphatase family metal-dependent hydrolase
MPFYRDLDPATIRGKRTLERLLALRGEFENQELPERNLESTLLIATWNIREFDSASYGTRTDESLQYIAEIVSRFDVVAVQEVRRSLDALDRLMRILGSYWSYLVSDVTEGSKGNRERLALLYDSRKVRLSGLVGEIVLPPIDGNPIEQIDRTPYLVGFTAGWAKFALVTAHLRWGSDNANDPGRLREIEHLAAFLDKRANDTTSWARNMILLGDFNIFEPTDPTAQALRDNGFVVPTPIIDARTNLSRRRSYDQIAFHVDRDRIDDADRGGVFDYATVLYRDEDELRYAGDMGDGYQTKRTGVARTPKERTTYYRQWRTHQLSDHLPLWTELRIDYSQRYLERKLAGTA